ncbi:MAG: NTP transferase domain-containing protein [Deltaproteobacteria bacterium]|nr:NTP transferase domain-containing protein [Deltaproteobacteria bacterium]
MTPIQLLIPMSGQGNRYQKAGYTQPKPLIPVSGIPMIERLLGCFPERWPTTFVLAINHKKTPLPAVLSGLRPQGQQIFIPKHALGPGHAISSALAHMDPNGPVLVSYCDYGMVWSSRQFEDFVRESECDACVVSYRGFHAHYLRQTNYAFSRLDNERVVEVREKGNFTNDREQEFASCGAYYFRTVKILERALKSQIEQNLSLNGEFYVSLTVQALLAADPNAHVRVFEIPAFFQWGTPEDLRNFEYWEKGMSSASRNASRPLAGVSQLLMPMAGKGSRFRSMTSIPKPFLQINEYRPMYAYALATLPPAKSEVFVALEEHRPHIDAAKADSFTFLSQTPDGQALSTEAGLGNIDHSRDVLVSSCDHGLVLDPEAWGKFIKNPRCDAAIFVVRGYPGARRRPTAYAYVETVNDQDSYPKVSGVSVKKPLSDAPERDYILVGTFWFARGGLLQSAIARLKSENIRVNGELYLDSIFPLMLAGGSIVRVIELDGYVNWGDPDALAEALYWQEVFSCHRLDRRPRFPGVKF